MRIYEFQNDRSEALRRQLVAMPASDSRSAAKQPSEKRLADFTPARSKAEPVRERIHLAVLKLRSLSTKLKAALLGLVLVGAAGGAAALVLAPADNHLDPSRIIGSLSRPQQESDKLPAAALATLPKNGDFAIDPSQIRLLGHGATYTYYGAPAGDKICLIPVDATGEGRSIGCTLLNSFEAYGLRSDSPDRTEAGWLVVPAGAKKALESVQNEGGWSQQAPNFLVRTNH